MIKKIIQFWVCCVSFAIVGCQSQQENNENKATRYDTPTSGEITIAVDEAFYLLAKQQVDAFMNEYENTKINIMVLPEDKAIQLMLRDSVDAVMVSRNLNANERQVVEKQKTSVKDWLQAYDALAVVVNKEVKDSVISIAQLKKIFAGDIKSWKQLNPRNEDEEIAIIIDNANSSNYNFVGSKLEAIDIAKLKIYASKSNKTTLEQVAKNKKSLGIVAFDWLKEADFSQIKLVAIQDEKNTKKPSQAAFAENSYPLRRECYTLVKGGRIGLAHAWATFVSQEIGQRIILKAGLLPAKIPTREIEMISE